MVFLFVDLAGYRRRGDTNSNPVLVVASIVVIAIVFGFFAVDTVQNAPDTFIAIIALGLLASVSTRSRDAATAADQRSSSGRLPPPSLPESPGPAPIAAVSGSRHSRETQMTSSPG